MRFGEVDRFLVPRGDRVAVRYFLDRLFVAHGIGERLRWKLLRATGGRLAGRLLFRADWRLEPETLSLRPMAAGWEEVNRAPWGSAGPLLRAVAGEIPVERSILLRDYGGSGRGQLVLFPFSGDGDAPMAVIKARRGGSRETEGGSLEAEGRSLRSVRESLPADLRGTLPRPLGRRAAGEVEILELSHLPGRSAYVEMQNHLLPRRRVEAHFRAAADWLAAFHGATLRPGSTLVPGPEDRARARSLAGATGTGDPPWYEDLLRRLAHRPIHPSAGHGDFWARNLLLAEERGTTAGATGARVVDWEHFQEEAPPFRDLFHFAVSYGANYPWWEYRRLPLPQAFRRTFLEDNHVSRAVRRYVARYGGHAGLSPPLLDRLFRLYLLRRTDGAAGEDRRRWMACWRALPDGSHPLFGG